MSAERYGWTSYDMHYDGRRKEYVIARTVREEVQAFPHAGGYEVVNERLTELREHGESRPETGYRIALRPDDGDGDPFKTSTLMDDIVVKDVSMFRAEQMGDGEWFACCYLAGSDDRIAWWISAKCRPRRIEWVTTEFPDVAYEDRSNAVVKATDTGSNQQVQS